jgi:hypothetical protein
MTKIEAIGHLEQCFDLNPEYAKKWRHYIELSVIEALNKRPYKLTDKQRLLIAQDVAEEVMDLFRADWWIAQEKTP